MLYDLVQCQHRPTMDLYGDPAQRDEINPFVRLLWEKGTAHEQEVIETLDEPILDLSMYTGEDKEQKTLEAIEAGAPMIYGTRIQADGLLGEPDLLRKQGQGYTAGDIKSGSGEESYGEDNDKKQKKHYGVQLALYTDILERLGLTASKKPFIWDIHGEEVTYDLEEPQGIRNPWTMWDVYQEHLVTARGIITKTEETHPAYSSGTCKMCHWYTSCMTEMDASDDLTLLPELGRTKRDAMVDQIATVSELAEINVESFITGKKTLFHGIGPSSLMKFHQRAKLQKTKNAQPYLTQPIRLPSSDTELFFDIEVDPMRDLCYLHGFVKRTGGDNSTERYLAFFTDDTSPEEEERAFAEAWTYIQDNQPCTVYYYSKYERTIWRKLQQAYTSVCSADDIENLFDPTISVDLYYDVVKKATEWPTKDYSIKTLATFSGFNWRDTHPSGAASIEWFDRWIQTSDHEIKQRILDYNEDDCIATRVVLDKIREL